jgi:hypothetical protein
MPNQEINISIPNEVVANRIYLVRGHRVMLDSDLAQLYRVQTKRLKEQVKRNIRRFPPAYMFELTEKEWAVLRSQIATSKKGGRGGNRYLPMVFTEHGVLQLSNYLNSERAEKVGFIIIDVFVKCREMLLDNTELRLEIEKIKKKVDNHNQNIELVFQYLDELVDKKEKPRTQIGYKINNEPI